MSQDKIFKKTCDIIFKSFYVDDLVVAVNRKEIAQMLFDESITIISKANMNLRKWCSNNEEMDKYIKDKCLSCNHPNEHKKSVKKVLGIQCISRRM